MDDATQKEVILYIKEAREMLEVAQLNLDNDFYPSSINRAYYAVFYAANALLATKGMTRGKHSGVISAFRQHFIKTGLIDVEFSRIYGRLLEDRNESDYAIVNTISKNDAELDLNEARRFVAEVEKWLTQARWLTK